MITPRAAPSEEKTVADGRVRKPLRASTPLSCRPISPGRTPRSCLPRSPSGANSRTAARAPRRDRAFARRQRARRRQGRDPRSQPRSGRDAGCPGPDSPEAHPSDAGSTTGGGPGAGRWPTVRRCSYLDKARTWVCRMRSARQPRCPRPRPANAGRPEVGAQIVRAIRRLETLRVRRRLVLAARQAFGEARREIGRRARAGRRTRGQQTAHQDQNPKRLHDRGSRHRIASSATPARRAR
jgi:hypothetical protein